MNLPSTSSSRAAPLPNTLVGGVAMQHQHQHHQSEWILNRRKQINTLRIFNENVSEVLPDQQYRVDFTSVLSAAPLSLVVFLSPGFPKERPVIRLEPPGLRHPWLDPQGHVVGAPGLLNYTVHSDLGRVVQAIKRELERNPPEGVTGHTHSATATTATASQVVDGASSSRPPYPSSYYTSAASSVGLSTSPAASASAFYGHRPPTPAPTPVTSTVPGLSDLTLEQLQELRDDDNGDAAAKLFCRDIDNPMMERVEGDLRRWREDIDATLETTAEMQDRLEERRGSLLAALDKWHSLRGHVAGLAEGLDRANERASVQQVCDRLQRSSLEDEEESDRVADRFLAGQLDLDDYLKQYVEVRKSHHLKKVKADKLRRSGGGGGGGGTNPGGAR